MCKDASPLTTPSKHLLQRTLVFLPKFFIELSSPKGVTQTNKPSLPPFPQEPLLVPYKTKSWLESQLRCLCCTSPRSLSHFLICTGELPLYAFFSRAPVLAMNPTP